MAFYCKITFSSSLLDMLSSVVLSCSSGRLHGYFNCRALKLLVLIEKKTCSVMWMRSLKPTSWLSAIGPLVLVLGLYSVQY
jgi:hypothetical protein